MDLTSQAVEELTTACLLVEGEPTDGAIIVEGVMRQFGFDRARLTKHHHQIIQLLAELPEPFHASCGGGWTFLNGCNDRKGRQWTGEHSRMEELFCLGIAAGQARWLLPRDMWDALPGGMPYVAVLLAHDGRHGCLRVE